MLLLTLVFFWQLLMLYTNPKAWKARDKMLVRLRHGIDGDVDSEAAAEDQCLEEQTPDPSKNGVNNTKKRTDTGPYKIWHSLHPGLRWAIVMLLSPPAAIVWAFVN
jgi:hypothetical protein